MIETRVEVIIQWSGVSGINIVGWVQWSAVFKTIFAYTIIVCFRHEGRSWPTTHRGRLWIAAAAKVPEQEEIEALESFYRDYYLGKMSSLQIFTAW